MLSRRIIPCLDVTAGRVVKGVRFEALRDAGDPVECAAAYDAQGADELVFLDITASSDDRRILHDVVSATAERCFMPLTVGGGLRSVADIEAMLRAGADKVSLNTAAIRDPDLIRAASDRFGAQCIVLAIDAKREPGPGAGAATAAGPEAGADGGRGARWRVYTHGGRRPTELDAVGWARRAVELGAGEILLTSMDRDGTQSGYDLELTRQVSDAVPVPVIASGGAGRLSDFADVLGAGHASAVLAASLFHFGTFTVPLGKEFLAAQGVPVRPPAP
jgi:cyclase